MNKRAYYTDSYMTSFTANVIESWQEPAGYAVILDATYFYPTSGGQPHDTGTIENIPVSDVRIRQEDGAIVHLLAKAPAQTAITAVIDWTRRFDHMQQHTGQHILSQAFIQIAEAPTIGFHLSEESLTIDLDTQNLAPPAVDRAEQLANQIVCQNRPVIVRWATPEEAQNLPLRKIPATGDDILRLIDIFNFDLTACGGTHVARTGEVGQIKVTRQESRNQKVRMHFACGMRALHHHRAATGTIHELTTMLTTGQSELVASVGKLQEEEKEARRTIRNLQSELDTIEAQQLASGGQRIGDTTLVVQVFEDSSPQKIRNLALMLTKEPAVVTLLAAISGRTHLVFGRSPDAPGSMKTLLQLAFDTLGSGSGGGSETLAQGAAPARDAQTVQAVLDRVADTLLGETTAIG